MKFVDEIRYPLYAIRIIATKAQRHEDILSEIRNTKYERLTTIHCHRGHREHREMVNQIRHGFRRLTRKFGGWRLDPP